MIQGFAHHVRNILRNVGLVGARSTTESIGFEKIPTKQSFVALNQPNKVSESFGENNSRLYL